MSHTLIGTNVAYGAASSGTAASPDALVSGAIGAFGIDKTDGKFKLITATTIENFETFSFYQGLGGGLVLQSENFKLKCFKYNKSAYRAGTGDVIHIGYNGTAGAITPNAGLVATDNLDYYIKIWEDVIGDQTAGQSYNINAGTLKGGATQANIQDKIYNDLTAKLAGIATVAKTGSSTTLGVSVTFTDATKRYAILIDGDIVSTPRTVVSGDSGAGTPAKIAALENEDRIQRGFMYHDADFSKKLPSTLSSTGQYVLYYLAGLNITADKDGQKGETTQDVYTYIAVPTGQAIVTSLDALLPLLASGIIIPEGGD